ncbi:MAG: hypothetical protein AB8C02_19295 [Halioglobus sp.]
MIAKVQVALLALILCVISTANAHDTPRINGITDDGRRVILRSDHTWDFLEVTPGDPETSAVLTVLEITDLEEACRLKLHLKNNLDIKITHLVPRFNIYNNEGVLFDTVSKSFSGLKPGKDLYTKVQFSGVGCSQISRVHLFSASRCRMGDIDIWNEKEGQCLSRIYVEPTDLINITK